MALSDFGGKGILEVGDVGSKLVSARFLGIFADRAELKALPVRAKARGAVAFVAEDRSLWTVDETDGDGDEIGALVLTPDDGLGRMLRCDRAIDLKLPVAFDTADEAVLFTVPDGFAIVLSASLWNVDTAFTGGTDAAIGLSSSNAALSDPGALLGGETGALEADLAGGISPGIHFDAVTTLVAGDTILFNAIADAFEAGAGHAHVLAQVLS